MKQPALSIAFLLFMCKGTTSRVHFSDEGLYNGSPCIMHDGRNGTCTLNCSSKEGFTGKPKICGFEKTTPVICCYDEKKQSSLVKASSPTLLLKSYPNLENSCVIYNPLENIPADAFVFGWQSELGEHPHMAALGWTDPEGNIEWNCGGSLIHPKYILTAAHCTTVNGQPPDTVRLGDINLKNDSDNVLTIDNNIRNIFIHPDYNSSQAYNDIAILEIENRTMTNISPRPACIYAEKQFPVRRMLAMGYGTTGFSEGKNYQLFQGFLTVMDSKECDSLYKRDDFLPRGVIDTQICAYDPEGMVDTCQGDSGGPLQYGPNLRTYLVGITSFGEFCATTTPGVYTRIHSYIDWIENIIGH